MIAYLDTSVLVAWLTREDRVMDIMAWLDRRDFDELALSDWSLAEFSAAVSASVRANRLTIEKKIEALASLRRLSEDTFITLPVDRAHFVQAARFADAHRIGLRSGDALHLAIADFAGAKLVTLDKRQAKAGEALRVTTMLL